MKIPIKQLPVILFLAGMIHLSAAACEKPSLELPQEVMEVTAGTFSIEWPAVPNATQYEVRYSMRVPEGRTFIQRELTVDKPALQFPASELGQAEVVQVIANISTHCGTSKSEPRNMLIALRSAGAACRFDTELPHIAHGMLRLPVSAEVQSYLVCSYREEAATVCKEVPQLQEKYAVTDASYLGVTPLCKNSAGKPFYVSNLKKKAS